MVRVQKRGSELVVRELSVKQRPRALELARDYLALAETHVGATRAELEEAFGVVTVAASERKLAVGLQKLVEDRLEFEVSAEEEPRVLRSEVFLAAAESRKALIDGANFERERVLEEAAARRHSTADVIEKSLYADLRGAQVLTGFAKLLPDALVEGYDLAQQQAVLLKAVDLIADVRCRDPYAYRVLFRKLKFFRLVHRIEARVDGGYRIFIDGPFSLFTASTKYGLELALALPYMLSCDEYVIRASLRWGKERAPLTYKLEGRGRGLRNDEPTRLPDEVDALLNRFCALDSAWQADVSSDILDVPGSGLCVPDLRFIHRETGEIAYLEVMGYWSRDAVFKRIDLVREGLAARVLFAVSSRLRVSEALLGDDVPSELYVYKGSISATEVLRRLLGERA
jgi:predicted nuclease of restriction endonuclease-like RecB superfamily